MIKINIQPFTLPLVAALEVKALGEPFKKEAAPGTFMAFRRIYYELKDVNDRIRELGEVEIPESIYAKCGEFVMGDVSQETLSTVNAFFQQAGWENVVAVNVPG